MENLEKIKHILVKTFLWKLLQSILIWYRFHFVKNNSQWNYHKYLKKYLNYKDGYYIEIGANDGVRFSNTLFLEKNLNWKGILIEPSNKFYLLKKYRGKNNKIFNLACSSFEQKNQIKEYVYADLSTFSKDKFDKSENLDNYLNHINFSFTDNFYNFKTKVKPLNDLLDEAQAPRIIDFFSLDVEGEELDVLKGIDFKEYSFKFILVEGFDDQVSKFLSEKKYTILEKLSHDTLFKNELK